MNIIKRIGQIKWLALLAAAALLNGCTTVPEQERLATTIKVASFVGTSEALRAHPEWEPGFKQAAVELEALLEGGPLNISDILVIVRRLPVGELRSERATLYIMAGTILLEEFAGRTVDLDKVPPARTVAQAILDGITMALPPS